MSQAFPPPRLVAHRGWQKHYPENTILAYRQAAAAGARYVECDLQFSRDLEPLLFHDVELDRVCGSSGLVFDRRWDELKKLSAGETGRLGQAHAAEPLAHLKDFVAFLKDHPQVRAFVEMKEESLQRYGIATALPRVLEILSPVKHQCDHISFSLDWCEAVKKAGPFTVGYIAQTWEQFEDPRVKALAPEFCCVDYRQLPQGEVKIPGAALFCWEISDPALAKDLQARGVDYVETFEIGEMIQKLR